MTKSDKAWILSTASATLIVIVLLAYRAGLVVAQQENRADINKEFEYLESKIQHLEHAQAMMVGSSHERSNAEWSPDKLWQLKSKDGTLGDVRADVNILLNKVPNLDFELGSFSYKLEEVIRQNGLVNTNR